MIKVVAACIAFLLGSALLPSFGSEPTTFPQEARTLVGFRSGFWGLLSNPKIQREIKMTPDQFKQCKHMNASHFAKSREFYKAVQDDGKVPEAHPKFEHQSRIEYTGALSKILSAEQMTRFLEINFQLQEPESLFDESTCAQLKLSEHQIRDSLAIKQGLNDQLELIMRDPLPADSKRRREVSSQIIVKSTERFVSLLSDEQKQNLKTLEGPKFKEEE